MIVMSGLIPKAVSFLSLLASAAAVFDDTVEQRLNHRDADLTNKAATSNKKTYIVTFIDNAVSPTERCEALALSMGGFVDHVYDQVLNGCSLTFPAAQAQAQDTFTALGINTAVMAVEEDQIVHLVEPPANHHGRVRDAASAEFPDRGHDAANTAAVTVSSWGLDRIDQCTLPLDGHSTKQDARGVRVFIVDTGIRSDHEEFANGVISNEDCHYTGIPGETALSDGNGHGTHVAGTTCGAKYGVSTNCQLCIVKVVDAGGFGSISGIIAGIQHVVSKCSVSGSTPCVVNMSLGDVYSVAWNQAVAAAVNSGIVVVVAAGNESSDACNFSPASEPLAITVGSTDIEDQQSWFSNWGSCVDIDAPGSDIVSSFIETPTAFTTYSGTSMASPHVAGMAAALRSANPSWTPLEVRNAIVKNAAPLPSRESLAIIDDVTYCSAPVASFLKVELATGVNIHMFEVKVLSLGNNVAAGKLSSQSSTLNNFFASLAVDGKASTFSHTNVVTSGSPVWWQVNLGNNYPIQSATIMNRWCGSSADPNGCLCRLSNATLALIDSEGVTVGTQTTGNTCGKQELIFDDFMVPTPAPTLSPSYTPTASINPTSALVDDFSLVGQGYCLDKSHQYYSYVISENLPARTKDTYCLDWCSQNPDIDLVGVEVYRFTNGVYCLCDFSEGVPDDINITDYSPPAYWVDESFNGTGAILLSFGPDYAMCYRYDNYKTSYPVSAIKIELGTGKDIHMFEVQAFSLGKNVVIGKPSTQSSTLNNYFASLAVDGKVNTFSHTKVATSGTPVWWKVDLGNEFPIQSMIVMNRWCGSYTDPNGCLCRLSNATLSLIDGEGVIVGIQTTGDTCGKRELLFNDFMVPTPAPTLSPSYTPTSSLNPTSTLVKDFSLVGQGSCLDESYEWYSYVQSDILPSRTKDNYCLDWCSQNTDPNLVGVEVYRWSDDVYCLCDFSEGVPDGIKTTDYKPPAYWVDDSFNGTGAILTSDGYYYAVCYRYDNYDKYLASTVKIELGTGKDIHMFEVQVNSSGNNVAAGKPCTQSSTLNNYFASLAVDGKANTFSHTKVATSGTPVWWKVDLGNVFSINSLTVINRWCGSSADPNGCLCRLSNATLSLIDSEGVIVGIQTTGNTCGKRELLFNDFMVPTPAPTLSPSYTPTSSPNPTSTLVEDFSLVGQGYCLDESYEWYSYVQSDILPSRTKDTYCLDWCSQNTDPNLVGVEVYRRTEDVYCLCDFSEGVPDGIKTTDYKPPAYWVDYSFNGTGAILTSSGPASSVCYRYDNYKRSFPASTVKIELGTGKNIHMFEVQVLSVGSNIAAGKPSSQSSTLNNLFANLAVDGKVSTFSHTNVATSGSPVWWKVDLGNDFLIESVTILNRWCGSSVDSSGCLCRLTNATLTLINSEGVIVGSQSTGNTCGKQEISFDNFLHPYFSFEQKITVKQSFLNEHLD